MAEPCACRSEPSPATGEGQRHTAPPNPQPRRRQHLLVRSADVMRVLRVSEIEWLEADGHHVRIHAQGEIITVRQRLRSFEEVLDPVQFVRIHRSTIVNLDRVRELRHWFGGDYQVLLCDGAELRLSRNYRDRLNGYTLQDHSGDAELG